jgi:hypothetical protein
VFVLKEYLQANLIFAGKANSLTSKKLSTRVGPSLSLTFYTGKMTNTLADLAIWPGFSAIKLLLFVAVALDK